MANLGLADKTHPLYDDNLDLWTMYLDAANGGNEFINDDYLFSHRLEESSDFTERLDRAYFLNFCDTIPNIYNSFIFKSSIERAPDNLLDGFRKNMDGRGTHISDFIKRLGYYSSVFGVIHALIDMPPVVRKARKLTVREARTNNLVPFGSIVLPTQLKDWSVDSQGNYNWVIIESTYYSDLDPSKEREEQTHYKLITKEKWSVEDTDGNAVKFDDGSPNQGVNPLGIIPLITMYHKDMGDDKIGKSLLKDIVYVNRVIMNWCSCIDEQIERQTFSQLVIPDDGTIAEKDESGKDPMYKVGTSSIWTFPYDAKNPPQFISPNTENINVIWKMVIDHIKEIFRMSGLLGTSDDLYVSKSGRAAQMGFLGVNSALAEKAARYQKFENEISKLAYLYLGGNVEAFEEVKYPSSFDLLALSDEIEAYFKVMSKNFSVTLNKTLQKNIVRRALPLATQSIKETIEREIDAGSGEVNEVQGQPESKSFDDNSGNPNTNLGDTTRTKDELEKEEVGHRKEEE